MVARPTREQIFEILTGIPDPEVPAINIVELGVVRDVVISDGELAVVLTPTYSGCPAMAAIEGEVLSAVKNLGFAKVSIKTVYSPPWTTDWLSPEAKAKLKAYGIAPPQSASSDLVEFPKKEEKIPCPFCNSLKTECKSRFGSTACKALYYCNACEQPFEYFKTF